MSHSIHSDDEHVQLTDRDKSDEDNATAPGSHPVEDIQALHPGSAVASQGRNHGNLRPSDDSHDVQSGLTKQGEDGNNAYDTGTDSGQGVVSNLQMPEHDDDAEAKSITTDTGNPQMDQRIVDQDPFCVSKLFTPSGKSIALGDTSGILEFSSHHEGDQELPDPDPLSDAKLFTNTSMTLGLNDNPVMVLDGLPPLHTGYRRDTTAWPRRRNPTAGDRLLDFISNNDAAEMFDSSAFGNLLAEAKNEQLEILKWKRQRIAAVGATRDAAAACNRAASRGFNTGSSL